MKFHTNLAAVARRTGFPVTEVKGWQSRGNGGMANQPTAVICHHTAGPSRGDYPSLDVVTNGRPGLENSLSAFGLGRSGRIFVIAAGESFHAGVVRDESFSNQQAFGIEAENTGVGERWSAPMLESYARLCAELCREFGISPSMVRGHKEACSPSGRKIDPAGIDMDAFRRTVAARLKDPSTKEEDVSIVDQATKDFFTAMEDRLNTRIGTIDKNSSARLAAIEKAIGADPNNPVTQDQLNKAVKEGLAGAKITLATDGQAVR